MFALPKWLGRHAVVAALATGIGVLAVDSAHVAAAQGRLEAEYTATVAGIPIGRGNWVIEIAEDQFTAAASGTTTGVFKFLVGASGTSASRGIVVGGQLVPTSYASTINGARKIDDVRIVFSGGNVRDYSAEPPVMPHPSRIPVSDADRRGVIDPMTSALTRVAGNADPISPLACGHHAAVFDGRLRYDLRSEFKRIDMVKAERGYQGPAVVCAVYFTPISGYVPDRPIIRYLIALRDAEVWMVPISGTRVVVPFRLTLPTPLGQGVLQAIRFNTVAQMPHAAINAKTQ